MEPLTPSRWSRRFLALMTGALAGNSGTIWLPLLLSVAALLRPRLRQGGHLWIGLLAGLLWHARIQSERTWLATLDGIEVDFSCWCQSDAVCREYRPGRHAWEFEPHDLRLGPERRRLILPAKASWRAPPGQEHYAPKCGDYWRGSAKIRIWNGQTVFLSIPRTSAYPTLPQTRPDHTPLKVRAALLSAKLRQRLARGHETDATEPLVAAIVLGTRGAIPKATYDTFRKTGMVHILAVSGLHVGIVAALIYCLLTRLRTPPRTASLLSIPCCIAYTILTGLQPSALRACLMASIYLAARVLRRQCRLPDALLMTGSTVWILCWPLAWRPGWLLSFTVMAALCWLFPLLRRTFETWLSRDRRYTLPPHLELLRHWFSSDELRTDENILRALAPNATFRFRLELTLRRITVRWFFNGLLVSVTAWLAALPLGLHFFGQLTFAGILGNIAIVTLAACVLATGIASLATGWICPPIGLLLGHLANRFAGLMLSLAQACETTGLYFQLPKIPVWTTILLYLALLAGYWLLLRWTNQHTAPGDGNDARAP
ncbi:MAG: ComEC/Rec2 family competence protein [Kiritimatiellia bacterium]|nr:ComEC/Rec2 family competence protein [Kiritimatiellia bacterium]